MSATRNTRWVIEDELRVAQQMGVDFADIGTSAVADRINARLEDVDIFCVRCGGQLPEAEENGMCTLCDVLLQEGRA